GLVDADGDGPVQVCVPVDGAVGAGGRVGVRVEPARREAYTELRKGRGAYADVAGALDAVVTWLDERGLRPSGPPREIYCPVPDQSHARSGVVVGGGEHVMDVAVPFVDAAEAV
ncbi:MAG TPA: hypothetical protein VFP69_16390, partial [Streptomyces sp.]|nr:hypothetical protein [Streptomyces sp.]